MKNKKIMPTTFLLIAIVVLIALHFLYPGIRIIPPLWNLLGVIPLTLGITINLVADRAFHRAHTTVKPFEESSVLITNSVFRISRNPMYLGFVLILIGIAFLVGTLTPYVVVLAFAIYIEKEPKLTQCALDRWVSSPFSNIYRAWSLPCFQAMSTPAHLPLRKPLACPV